MGKALSGRTKILTTSGFKEMKDINVGDYVYDETGKPVRVINKTEEQKERDCFAVSFRHGETIIADGEHEWKVSIRGKESSIVTTEDLFEHFLKYENVASKCRPSVKIEKPSSIEFDEQDVPLDPYTLGLWLGDGFSISNKVTCHVDDYEFYKTVIPLSEGVYRKNSTTCIDFKFESFGTEDLVAHDLRKNKRIPKEYVFNSKEVRMELLRGLMDSDGTVEKNGVCRFYQSDLSFIEDVRILLSTLGIKSTLRSKETGCKVAYTLCFVCNEFDVFKLPRKLSRQYLNTDHPKNHNFYVKSVERVESESVYCIEVDNESHLFLAGTTLIPTHNCVIGESKITVRNRSTGEIKSISIEEFHEMNKGS